MDTSLAWEAFCAGDKSFQAQPAPAALFRPLAVPVPSTLYISTRTNIAYLNGPVDLEKTFWALPVVPHHMQTVGIIKKQMKVNSSTEAQLQLLFERLPKDQYVTQHVIDHIEAVPGRIEYKDVRKISIGICNKDVSSYRCKKRGAFYNCFSVIVRVRVGSDFHEMHVKVFNTGKLEVPGVQCSEIFSKTLDLLCDVLNALVDGPPVSWLREKTETVLINSNFSTGFLVDREKLYEILRTKYQMQGRYDPCSYPGIQCDFYLDPGLKRQTGAPPPVSATPAERDTFVRMSFMVFRTGSVLIVGKCSEVALGKIYDALCRILGDEYPAISTGLARLPKTKSMKNPRLKTTLVTYTPSP